MNFTSEQLKNRREITKRNAMRLKRPVLHKAVVWLFPDAAEKFYRREMIKMIDSWLKDVKTAIDDYFPLIVEELGKTVVKSDSIIDFFEPLYSRVMGSISSHVDSFISVMNETVSRVSNWNKKQFAKVVHSVTGIRLIGGNDAWQQDVLDAFTLTNCRLIKNISEELTNKITNIIQNGVVSGKSIKTIREELVEAGIKSRKRAELIACDQVGKLNAQMTMNNQVSIGVKSYIWRDSRDERVRPEHKARNGKEFKWKEPPGDGHPGMAVRCRCYAEPVLEDVLQTI